MNNYFEVKNLTKLFKSGVGVEDVTFAANSGSIIGFVGANGAGKTTTIRLIFGLLKKDSGEVLLNGKDVLEKNILQKIAFFPDQNNYPDKYKIADYIAYNAELSGIVRKEAIKRTNILLDSLGLTINKKQTFKKLSSGMQKRVLLAAVLVNDPEIIILDEPTANLDVSARTEFMKLLISLAKKGIIIIITSHIIAELQEVINHLLIMKNGKIVYDQSFDSEKEKIQEIYSNFNQDGSIIKANELNDIFRG